MQNSVYLITGDVHNWGISPCLTWIFCIHAAFLVQLNGLLVFFLGLFGKFDQGQYAQLGASLLGGLVSLVKALPSRYTLALPLHTLIMRTNHNVDF